MKNPIVRPALATALLLIIPLLGNRFIEGWNWTLSDFTLMGVMIFGTGLLIEWTLRLLPTQRYRAVGIILFLFLWLWAELAVGVFTNWGS